MTDEQATLFEALGEPDPDECQHEDVRVFSVVTRMHCPDNHPWLGKHPIYCLGCSDVIDRVRPEDLESSGYVRG